MAQADWANASLSDVIKAFVAATLIAIVLATVIVVWAHLIVNWLLRGV